MMNALLSSAHHINLSEEQSSELSESKRLHPMHSSTAHRDTKVARVDIYVDS